VNLKWIANFKKIAQTPIAVLFPVSLEGPTLLFKLGIFQTSEAKNRYPRRAANYPEQK